MPIEHYNDRYLNEKYSNKIMRLKTKSDNMNKKYDW